MPLFFAPNRSGHGGLAALSKKKRSDAAYARRMAFGD